METQYHFQTDWFSPTIDEWDETLANYQSKPSLAFLEIGSFEGRSAIWLLENILTDPTSHLTCIDTWGGSAEHQNTTLDFAQVERNFDDNIRISGKSTQVKKIKGRSAVELRKLAFGSYDFIYIDASHKAYNVLEDAVLSWRLLKIGGIMIFDDYVWEPQYAEIDSPKLAVDSFIQCYRNRLEIVRKGMQMTIRKTHS
ncbi:class I SAM-dependent methyltransferase [Candidatus Woesebacteria bacterium]|nr:class I SAM-dependent methyltransferase [Candidatus Woesebacteria bacterium]